MTGGDYKYLISLIESGYICGPALELGAGLEGSNAKPILQKFNIQYFGTDVLPGSAVNFVLDFESPAEIIADTLSGIGLFGSILIFNVLEHVFNPLVVLDNAIAMLRPGGTCAILTPAVWPIHAFPIDCWRLLPGFYIEYARRRKLTLIVETFVYIHNGAVHQLQLSLEDLQFPRPVVSNYQYWKGRIIHRLFDTFGRGMSAPANLAVGVVLKKDSAS